MGCTQVAPMETAKAQPFCFPCEAVEPGAGDCLRGAMAWGLAGGVGFRKFHGGSLGKEGVPCWCHTHLCSRSGSSPSLGPRLFWTEPSLWEPGAGGCGRPRGAEPREGQDSGHPCHLGLPPAEAPTCPSASPRPRECPQCSPSSSVLSTCDMPWPFSRVNQAGE